MRVSRSLWCVAALVWGALFLTACQSGATGGDEATGEPTESAAANTAANGEMENKPFNAAEFFRMNCASCHGANGDKYPKSIGSEGRSSYVLSKVREMVAENTDKKLNDTELAALKTQVMEYAKANGIANP